MRASICLLQVVVSIGTLTGCCRNGAYSSAEVDAVIAWADNYPLGIGHWRAAQVRRWMTQPEGHAEEWEQEGRSLGNAEDILCHLLRRRDQRLERPVAIGALSVVGTGKSVPLLLEALEDDWNVTRGEAIQALRRIGDKRAVWPLARALRCDPTSGCRVPAAIALAEIGDTEAVAVLRSQVEEMRTEANQIESVLRTLETRLASRSRESVEARAYGETIPPKAYGQETQP